MMGKKVRNIQWLTFTSSFDQSECLTCTGADWRLLVISKRTLLGNLPGGHEVYRIDRVAVLTLSANESPEFELDVSLSSLTFIFLKLIAFLGFFYF